MNKGVKNVIVTCGSRGALVKNADTCAVVPACRVSAVDTTAAGDVFNGALTVALATIERIHPGSYEKLIKENAQSAA